MENFEPLSGNNQEEQEVTESFVAPYIPHRPPMPLPSSEVTESFNNEEKQKLNILNNNCIDNVPQRNEKVGNLCDSVSTFENSYTTQGLDSLTGFDKNQLPRLPCLERDWLILLYQNIDFYF